MKKKCKKCGKVSEHYAGNCLECDENPFSKRILREIKQYKDWTGDENWEYDIIQYNRALSEKMYKMVIDGYSVSEICGELNESKTRVHYFVLWHCLRNNLEIPFERRIIKRRKPRIVRQCPVCLMITATTEGSGYEVVCKGCTNFPDTDPFGSKQRHKEWIARENADAESKRKRRAESYDSENTQHLDVITECDDEIFFGYLKVDFNRQIITLIGKKAEDMYEIVGDIEKVWDICRPRSKPVALKDGTIIESYSEGCPVYNQPRTCGPNGISHRLAPVVDWEISIDMHTWWFEIQGKNVSFLSMKFSDWLRREYIENKRNIDELTIIANTSVFSIEYALKELSIPLRPRETFKLATQVP